MKIGIDGSEAFVKNRTGVENYSFQIIYHLSLIDKVNNYIIYLDPRTNELPSRELGFSCSTIKQFRNKKDGEWPKNFQFKALKWPLMWTQLGLAKQSYTDHLDLLFIPSHTLPLLKNPFLKSVVTVHDLGAEYLPGMHQLKQRLYLGLMTKLQLKGATKIIAVSEATKKDLIKKADIRDSKIKVIYEGFETNLEFNKKDTDNNSTLDIDIFRKKYFLFVGTIQPRKNLANLIKGYYQYLIKNPQAPILVLAGGKGWLSDEIYKLPKELGIENQVIFTGRVSDIELASLYQNAIALTYPSLFEGFGLPILEAFNFGVPVITSNTSSMPEVGGDAALYVDPNSVMQIAEALETIEKDLKLRDNLVRKGYIQLKKFSWEKAAKETLELFEEAING